MNSLVFLRGAFSEFKRLAQCFEDSFVSAKQGLAQWVRKNVAPTPQSSFLFKHFHVL